MRTDRRARGATLVIYGVLALTIADNTTVGVALPQVRESFRLGVTSLQWVVAGYIVAFAGLLFTGGVVGDRYGRKRALVAGISIFGAGGVLAAAAPDWRVLVAGRVVQGVGAACSEPGTLSLLRQLHPEEGSRLRVLGGWAAASGLALAAGPVLAGLLVQAGGWRAVFVAEAGAGAVAALLGARLLTESADPPQGRADLRGQVFAALTLLAFTYGLIEGQNRGFTANRVVAAWVVGAVAAVLLVVTERHSGRVGERVIDLRLLAERRVVAGLLAAGASTFALFAVLLLVSIDLQVVGGYGGLATAGVFAPMTAAMVLAGLAGSRLVSRMGSTAPLVGGLAVGAAATVALQQSLRQPVAVVPMAVSLTVMGLGFGLVVAPMVETVLARVPARRSGMGAAAVTAAREVGGVLGVATLGAIVNGLLFTDLTQRLVHLGIPTSYRRLVLDAVRGGAPVPHGSPAPAHATLLERLVHAAEQSLIDRTVDAGKAAYVASLRSALAVAVVVLAVAAAAVVALLWRHTPRESRTTVSPRC